MHPKRIIPVGINYLLIEYEDKIDPKVNAAVSQVTNAIKESKLEGIVSMIPTYKSLLVEYNPKMYDIDQITEKIKNIIPKQASTDTRKSRIIKIPVLYGGEHGPDLKDVAELNNLSVEEVIDIHSKGEYRVYMLGFNPGYPYMGGLDKRLATPRLLQPRVKVPAGSVAIGGAQTGIYSTTSPGGWRIIGHTPLPLFNASNENPVLLRAGDDVVFVKITFEEYQVIEEQVKNGTYQYDIVEGEENE